jgi:ribosomal protein S18 acetylase RimI-like enzyme
MGNVMIRNYRKRDETAIEEITYQTGFQGEGLAGRDFFDDKRLFYMIFIAYYPRYEPEHFFVAVDTAADEKVVGFIGGTHDTAAQARGFRRRMAWRIPLRLFLFTSWRYPRTFRNALALSKMREGMPGGEKAAQIHRRYPAHLHINLLPGYQGQGIGSRLMRHFEAHLVDLGVPGVHLVTSNHNRKAVPFYKKLGFTVIHESAILPHPVHDDLRLLTFAKQLGGP